jgi:hypothetical protein
LALFDRTKKMFDDALGLLAGYSMSIIFVSLAVSVSVALVHWSIPIDVLTQKTLGHLHSWVGIVVCSLLGLFIIKTANDIGNRIGGSCASFDAGSAVGATMGAAFGAGRLTRTLSGTSMATAARASRGVKGAYKANKALSALGEGAGEKLLKAGVGSGPKVKDAPQGIANSQSVNGAFNGIKSGNANVRSRLWK